MIDPIRYYELLNTGISTIQNGILTGAVANNQQIIAAITGKRHRAMGWIIQSTTGVQGSFVFKSSSGGAAISSSLWAPPNTALPYNLEIKDCGYFETNTGEGLFVDVVTAGVYFNVFYLTYTP
jgi:hypothetical protein